MCEWEGFCWHPMYVMNAQKWTEEVGAALPVNYLEYWDRIRDLDIYWFDPEIPLSFSQESWQ